MANHEINEEQEAVNKALRMIETSDPVHADVYNALFSVLINNDVFLEKLANKMVQQVMISHVMDSTNPDMVMGADQGLVITKLIEKVREQVDVLNTKAKNMQRSYLGTLGNTSSGSVTLPGLSKYKWLIIVPYGGQPSAPAVVMGGGVRFSGVATDANTASIYEVGFWITGDTLTFSFNKSYVVPSGTESQMTFGDVYGIVD